MSRTIGRRLVERAEQVLALGQVDAGLAADGRVHLGDERRRDLDPRHAAQVRGREEARPGRRARRRRSRPAARAARPAAGRARAPPRSITASSLGGLAARAASPSRPASRRARSPSATPSPNAAQAPGSETRIARRASSRWSAALTASAAMPSPTTTSPILVVASQQRGGRGTPGRDEPLDGLDHARQLGDAVDPRAPPRRSARGPRRAARIRPTRVAALDQRPDVGRAAQALAEDLGADVEPDRDAGRGTAPSGCAGRRSRRRRARSRAGAPGPASGGPSAATASRSSRAERRLAVVREDLGDPAARRRARSARRGPRTSPRGGRRAAARRRSCRCPAARRGRGPSAVSRRRRSRLRRRRRAGRRLAPSRRRGRRGRPPATGARGAAAIRAR